MLVTVGWDPTARCSLKFWTTVKECDGQRQCHGTTHGEIGNVVQPLRPPFERPSVVRESGLEVWRLLTKRYDSNTTVAQDHVPKESQRPARCSSSGQTLGRVSQPVVAETARAVILIPTPVELIGTLLKLADLLREHWQVQLKIVILLDAHGHLKDPNTMGHCHGGHCEHCLTCVI